MNPAYFSETDTPLHIEPADFQTLKVDANLSVGIIVGICQNANIESLVPSINVTLNGIEVLQVLEKPNNLDVHELQLLSQMVQRGAVFIVDPSSSKVASIPVSLETHFLIEKKIAKLENLDDENCHIIAHANFNVGQMLYHGECVEQDTDEAIKFYERAAKLGSAQANYVMGVLHYKSEKYGASHRYFERSALLGNSDAQFNLGRFYYKGDGVPQNYAEAANWYRLAAEQGDADAQLSLGEMYEEGEGVPQDNAEAVKWYRLAAEQGFDFAQFSMGYMYENGRGVPQNYAEALKWFTLAAEQGLTEATAAKKLLENKMTKKQITEAQILTRDWFNEHQ